MEKPLDDILDDFSKFYTVLILYECPRHGYAIMTKYRQRTGHKLSAGMLYPFLQLLEKQGIIDHKDEPSGKRPKRIYTLTRKGRQAVDKLFARFASITSAAFESNIQVCASCGCKVYEGAHYEKIGEKEVAFCCHHCAMAYKQQNE